MNGKKSDVKASRAKKAFMARHKKAAAEGGRSFCLICGHNVGFEENFAVIYGRDGEAMGVCHENCAYETQNETQN